ncbi:hypothetical protein [Chryseolinea lacunae]|uniref:Uncharacterized protein n=1 Tax=Chryseolinea lacunae TaxID=2801331 RepID=A0ABS1L2N3_9BACT|nr:hypothetical protein [Chryseolinea lacunae]MBL0745708.1 hypothetical protein [Chryseolinea lacunae]
MKFTNSPYPLVKLPIDIQLPLFLIKEELKSRKLFQLLQEVGTTESVFEPHLDSLIFQVIGLDDDDDRISDKYFDIMEKRSKNLEADKDSIAKQAFKAYHEILAIKKKMAKGK